MTKADKKKEPKKKIRKDLCSKFEPSDVPIWSEFEDAKKTNKKKEKPVIYECFNFYSEEATTTYWKDFFMNIAKGVKLPHFFLIKNNELQYKNKKIQYGLELNKETGSWSKVSDFFRKYGGFYSEEDENARDKKEKLFLNSDSILEWKDIKRKKEKNSLISNYVYDLKEKYDLTKEEKDQLETVINLNFLTKKIQNANVIYEDSKITNINVIVFNESRRIFTLKKESIKKETVKKETVSKTVSFPEFFDTRYIFNKEKKSINLADMLVQTIGKIYKPELTRRKTKSAFQSISMNDYVVNDTYTVHDNDDIENEEE